MPEVSLSSVVLAVLGILFTAGVTWGVFTTRQKSTGETIKDTIRDLREAVNELKSLSTDLQVMKSNTDRHASDISKLESRLESYGERISALEIQLAKLHR